MFEPRQTLSKESGFSSILVQAIRDGLTCILGSSGTEAVMKNFHLESFLDNPREFHNALLEGFKMPGATVLERAIVKDLLYKIAEQYDSSTNFDFETYVNFAKKLFIMKKVKDL